jgi:predicted N-acyltransferase
MQLADIKLAQASKASLGPLGESLGQRILTCGNLLTFGQHGLAFAQGVDPELAWHGVAEVLYRVRQAEKLAGSANFVMIKDLHGPQVEDASFLKNLSYRFVETEPNMVLALAADWKSYDDYLASLASKYRANIRNGVFKPIEQAQCTVEHFTDMAGMQAEVHALYKEVQVNAGFRPFELQPEYFPALQEAAGERFRCSVVKREGKMLGFLVTIADGETAIAFHIGFDRAAAADLPIYLRLLHAGIADAIGLGCKRISFGRTALEPKAALGARPETFGVLIRHRQPLMNKVIKHLLLNIDHDEAPDRSPFKKTEGKAA